VIEFVSGSASSALSGREHIRIYFGWPNFARCTRYRRSPLPLLWQKNWNLTHCQMDFGVITLCYKTGRKVSSGIIEVLKGTVTKNPALMLLSGVAVVSHA
jgi:hypothetical protein